MAGDKIRPHGCATRAVEDQCTDAQDALGSAVGTISLFSGKINKTVSDVNH